MPLTIKTGNAWKTASPLVKTGGAWRPAVFWVRTGGVWKQVSLTTSISPPKQNASFAGNNHLFAPVTVSVSGGSPSSFSWGFLSASGGSFTLDSGQGTASVRARVSSVPAQSIAEAVLYCDMVAGPTTRRLTATVRFTNTSGGNAN